MRLFKDIHVSGRSVAAGLVLLLHLPASYAGDGGPRLPSFLVPGDKIALVSPSYYIKSEKVDSAAAVLQSWGFEVVKGPDRQYLESYAGTPEQRSEDILGLLRDTTVKAILCNRGGYGTIHLLDGLSAEDFAQNPKWLIGYSDVTTLLGMEVCSGVMGIHGPMGSSLVSEDGSGISSRLLHDLLLGLIPRYVFPAHPCNVHGKAEGTLVGGNLSTLVPLLGTWADALGQEDYILFVEEVGESTHNLDRLINTIILRGALDRCKGVILGQFTDCKDDLGCDGAESLLCSYFKALGVPVCCGFPAGHDTPNLPLIMGARVSLDVTASTSTLTFFIDAPRRTIYTSELE